MRRVSDICVDSEVTPSDSDLIWTAIAAERRILIAGSLPGHRKTTNFITWDSDLIRAPAAAESHGTDAGSFSGHRKS